MNKKSMMKWKKKSDKAIEEEFRRLLVHIGDCNGTAGLIDVVEGVPTTKQKRDFVMGWHENDE